MRRPSPDPPVRLRREDCLELTPPADLAGIDFAFRSHCLRAAIARGDVRTLVVPDWPRAPRPPRFVHILVERCARLLGWKEPLPPVHRVAGLDLVRAAREWGEARIVYTLGAQTHRPKTVRAIARSAIGAGADGLLVVSGGSPGRRLAGALLSLAHRLVLPRPFLPVLRRALLPLDSGSLLDLLCAMRRDGELPASLPLWAVADPHRDSVERTADKIARGAERILTQPPFLEEQCASWRREAERHEQLRGRITAGVPVLTSPASLRFWFLLLRMPVRGAALRLYEEIRELWREPRRRSAALDRWHRRFAVRQREENPAAGLHFMPMKHWGRLLDSGFFGELAEQLRQELERRLDLPLEIAPSAMRRGADARAACRVLFALRWLLDRGEFEAERLSACCLRIRLFATIPANTFQPPIALRTRVGGDECDVAIDLRPFRGRLIDPVSSRLAAALRPLAGAHAAGTHAEAGAGAGDDAEAAGRRIAVEAPTRIAESRILWPFNFLFWRRLASFQNAFGVEFDVSISGSPDTHPPFVEHLARRFLGQFRRAHADEPDGRFRYLEIGTAGAVYVRLFIQRLIELAPAEGVDRVLLRRGLTYVLADYSPQVIERARSEMGDVYLGVPVEHVVLEGGDPAEQLAADHGGRILRIHSTNVHDNLRVDKLARIAGRTYLVEASLSISRSALERCARGGGIASEALADAVEESLWRRGEPGRFLARIEELVVAAGGGSREFYHLWRCFWSSLRMEERLVPWHDLAGRNPFPRIPEAGELISRAWAEAPEDCDVVVPIQSIESGGKLLHLLHAKGALEIVDINLHELAEARDDPRKAQAMTYDGSIVYWFSAGLFARFARAAHPGLDVRVEHLGAFGKPHMSLIALAPR